MTFARPIDISAEPVRAAYVFLSVLCLLTIVSSLFSPLSWHLKLAASGIVLVCFYSGWAQLNRQRGWRVFIHHTGTINISYRDKIQHPAEIGPASFRGRLMISLPVRTTGQRYRYLLISASNNDNDDYRRLLVWLNHGQQKSLV